MDIDKVAGDLSVQVNSLSDKLLQTNTETKILKKGI